MNVESSIGNDLLGLLVVAFLVLLNGFFVTAEFALVSVRPTRVEELVRQGNRMAKAVQKAIQEPDRFIAATQLGITLASLGLGWFGEPALSHLIDPIVELIPIPARLANMTSHGISAAIAFSLITFLHVVLGELAPKSIALQRPEQAALIVAQPTIWTEWLFKPAIWVLNGAGNLVLRLLGFEPAAGHELTHSIEEIRMLVDASARHGMLDDSEHDMLDAVFELRQMLVRQIMIPRTEMVALPATATLHDVVALQQDHPHGKYPVYEKDIDDIVGVLYVRDIIQELAKGGLSRPIRPFVRKAIFLPETARINTVLAAFRDEHQHVAIVLDEYGGTAGMITLEDILEEIAGDIPDQFDTEEPEIARLPDGSWTVSGLARIEEVNEALNLSLSDENYDTIGGYVMGRLERIPRLGDEVQTGNVRFRVVDVDGMRIDRLHISFDGHELPPEGAKPAG
ncbi:MAG TPA: HlyC/CorC family transporter [Chloroflexi bacterium]|nr:HlyC/CorC family transporter [Chloroflexota bacterium]